MTAQQSSDDPRWQLIFAALEQLAHDQYDVQFPGGADELGRLAEALQRLAQRLDIRNRRQEKLDEIIALINAGLTLPEVMERVFETFQSLIPYNRIGVALIDEEYQQVYSVWARTNLLNMEIGAGYSAPLQGSSLEAILKTGKPRILNDLQNYLSQKPQSTSSQMIVREGMRSSLTCPLVANGAPVGFIFFSSSQPNTYHNGHIETFQRIANELSVIVEKGRLASALAAQNAELLRLDQLRDTFLSIAAHDLRNPIANIQVAASILLEDDPPLSLPEIRGFYHDIIRQTHHMLQLINDLLDSAQIRAGRLSLNLETCSLAECLKETVARHSLLAAGKGTRVIVVNPPDGDILADPLRLRQVLDNLISNAVKYSPPGATVTLAAERLADAWRIRVTDQGPGISDADRANLFREFTLLSARPTAGEKAIGLGLAITKQVVEAHSGQIGVESTPGQGATFWFTIPQPV